MKIAVIGGGIGGLTAALALLQRGIDAHVYEQAHQFAEIGAGIQISPNASSILHSMGLAQALQAWGVRPLAVHQHRWDDGRPLLRTQLAPKVEETFGSPYYQIHRADLLNILIKALPADRLHVGHRLENVTDDGERVHAVFENGVQVQADALVGADGIHSSVRSIMFGPEGPDFTGCVAYRGLVPAERLCHLDLELATQVWLGPGQHFVHYFVRNRELVNFVAVVEQSKWRLESWTEPADVKDALKAFEGWHEQVRAILGAADHTFRWALFDRQPMPRWSNGRMALLGDACHAMLPFLAQGAAQAIEDAAALAAFLYNQSSSDIPAALERYERVRLPRTSRVQKLSHANKTRFHLPDGDEQQRRDTEMARDGIDWSLQTIAWLYDHDASKLQPEETS